MRCLHCEGSRVSASVHVRPLAVKRLRVLTAVKRTRDGQRVWAQEQSIYRDGFKNKLLHFLCGAVTALAN